MPHTSSVPVRELPLDAPQWDALQRDLLEEGVPLPLDHRAEAVRTWVREGRVVAVGEAPSHLVALASRGVPGAPGHTVLTAPRVRPPADPALTAALARHLVEVTRRDRRILQVNLQLFEPDPEKRRAAAAALEGAGLRRLPQPNNYSTTLTIDLSGDEEAILGSFSRSARRNVREAGKQGVTVTVVDDPAWIPRMQELYDETLSRTGGTSPPVDWQRIVTFSSEHPELSRLVGIFGPGSEGRTLLAFAWGRHHGDHGEYSLAASTRATGSRVALAYPLVWDLVSWSRGLGAGWFDLGGVTPGSRSDGEDALGGISDFKRFFSKDEVEIMEEWVVEPTSIRARLARLARSLVRREGR